MSLAARTARIGMVVAGLCGLCACSKKERSYSVDIVAIVGGRPVSLPSFRSYFATNTGRPIAESSPKVASGLFDQFLREEIWRGEAGLTGSDGDTDRRNAPSLLLSRAGAAVVPTLEEIRREYDLHRERYRKPAQLRVARIFTRQREEAESARQRISKGEEFSKVAREVSRSPDAPSGGKMGLIARGDLPSEFESAVFRLKAGETSPVIAAEEGFLIFRVEEKEDARELTVEQAEPEIRRTLSRDMAQRYLQGLVETAKGAGRVRVLPDRLPFVYTGEFLPPGKES